MGIVMFLVSVFMSLVTWADVPVMHIVVQANENTTYGSWFAPNACLTNNCSHTNVLNNQRGGVTLDAYIALIQAVTDLARREAGRVVKEERNKDIKFMGSLAYNEDPHGETVLPLSEAASVMQKVDPKRLTVAAAKKLFTREFNKASERHWREIYSTQCRAEIESTSGEFVTIINGIMAEPAEDTVKTIVMNTITGETCEVFTDDWRENGRFTETKLPRKVRMPKEEFGRIVRLLTRGTVYGYTDLNTINPADFVAGQIELDHGHGITEIIGESYYWERRSKTGSKDDILKIMDGEEIKYGQANMINQDMAVYADTFAIENEKYDTDYQGDMDTSKAEVRQYYYEDTSNRISKSKTISELIYSVGGRLFMSPANKASVGYKPGEGCTNKPIWKLALDGLSKAQRHKLIQQFKEKKAEILDRYQVDAWVIYFALVAAKDIRATAKELIKGDMDLFWAIWNLMFPKDENKKPMVSILGSIDQKVAAYFKASAAWIYNKKNKKEAKKPVTMTHDEAVAIWNKHCDNLEGLAGEQAGAVIRAAQVIRNATGKLMLKGSEYAGLCYRRDHGIVQTPASRKSTCFDQYAIK